MFVYRELRRYGPDPWLVGQYFPIEDATGDLDRLTNGAIVGAATLAVAALLALLIGLQHGALDPHHHLGGRGRSSGSSSTGRSTAARGCARSTMPATASTRRAAR